MLPKYFALIVLLVTSYGISAQNRLSDSATSFIVNGTCGECKQRIQKALKVKGITSASWSPKTKILDLKYSPSKISIQQVHEIISGIGHDTEKAKAADNVYNALPDCCLYRDPNNLHHDDEEAPEKDDDLVRGAVFQNNDGSKLPLAGASIFWAGTNEGTISDSAGEFSLFRHDSSDRLAISYAGFKADTIAIADMHDVEIVLSTNGELSQVIVTSRSRTSYVDSYSPFRTAVMTKKELLKAACCNLSESFETNPSVDVAYSDAATGSKQIQLLGLSGNYTQLTVEGLPGPRGLATPLGLNSIAGPWVESIQLVKGAGSVVNGFESIAGQINVELRKPHSSESFYLNGYTNSMGKTDLNLNLAYKLNSRWSAGLLLHDDFMYSKPDFNKDGFRDQPTGNQFGLVHRWHYLNDNGFMSEFGIKLLKDSKTGGELSFSDKDKFSTTKYGLGINTDRYEAFAKIGYVFPEKIHRSIGLQFSAFDHDQRAYFGLRGYNAKQKNVYGNMIYQSKIGSDEHKFKTGISFLYDQYKEQLQLDRFARTEVVTGAFTEYTYSPGEKLDVVAGLRLDHNNIYGSFATPRFNIRYAPYQNSTFRFSIGRGQRTANVIAENMGMLVSSREFEFPSTASQRAYGLDPEVAWNKGLSFDQKFKLIGRDAAFAIDFYRNDFLNQVVVDIENSRKVQFYNLQGKSFSNSLQVELDFTPIDKLDVRLAYRFFDVKTTYDGQLLQKPLVARNRAFANIAYDLSGWKLDYTINFIGEKRIPGTGENPLKYRMEERSPSYITMNAQISRSLGNKKMFDIYLGGENLTNYLQQHAIIASDQPFGNYFDASMVWGPVSGRLVYTGFRYTIK